MHQGICKDESRKTKTNKANDVIEYCIHGKKGAMLLEDGGRRFNHVCYILAMPHPSLNHVFRMVAVLIYFVSR